MLATIDDHAEVFIPVEHVQTGEFFIQRVPIIGCYGMPANPILDQMVSEYDAPGNLGCNLKYKENINAMSCASIEATDFADSEKALYLKKVVFNLKECRLKEDRGFQAQIKKAVRMNFTYQKRQPLVEFVLK